MPRGRKRTGQTPQLHFRAPSLMWEELGRAARERGRDVSWVAREAVIREIVRHQASYRAGFTGPAARNYWADTAEGAHVADPSEADSAALAAGLTHAANPFVAITPADDDSAWYARVTLLGDGTFEVECLGPSLSEHRRTVHPDPEAAAAALHAWLARRPPRAHA